MSFGRVYDVFWEDDKIELLSDRAALLALFLISGSHRNAIGCFRLGVGAITDVRRFSEWGAEGASKALQELVEIGFIVRDERSGWILIRNALKHDPLTNKNAAIHALSIVYRVPKNTVVYQELLKRLKPQLEAHSKALEDRPGWPLASPSEAPSNDLSKPLRTPYPTLPIPKPEPKGGADAPPAGDGYAWVGKVIRLSVEDYDRWRKAYHAIPDFDAELQAADDHYAQKPPKGGQWFFPVSNWLKRAHQDALKAKSVNDQQSDDELYAGVDY